MTLPVRRVPLTAHQKRIFILVAIALLLAVIGGVAGTRLLTRPRKVRSSVKADLTVLQKRYTDALACLTGAQRTGLGDGTLVPSLWRGALTHERWPEALRRCRRLTVRLLAEVHTVSGAADAQSDRVPAAIRTEYHLLQKAAAELARAVDALVEQTLQGSRLPARGALAAADRAARRYEAHLRQVARLAELPPPELNGTPDAFAQPSPVVPAPVRLQERRPPPREPEPLAVRRRLFRSAQGRGHLPLVLGTPAGDRAVLWVDVGGRARRHTLRLPPPPAGAKAGPARVLAARPEPAWRPARRDAPTAAPAPRPRAAPCPQPVLWARPVWRPRLRRGFLQVGLSCDVPAGSPPARPAPAATPRTRDRSRPVWSVRSAPGSGGIPRPDAGALLPDGRAWVLVSEPHGLGRRLLRLWLAPGGQVSSPEILLPDLDAGSLPSLVPVASAGAPTGPPARLRRPRPGPPRPRPSGSRPTVGRGSPPAAGVASEAPRARLTHIVWARRVRGDAAVLLLGDPTGHRLVPLRGATQPQQVLLCGNRLYLLGRAHRLYTADASRPGRLQPKLQLPARTRVRLACLAEGVAVAWAPQDPLGSGRAARHVPPAGYARCTESACSPPVGLSWSRVLDVRLLPTPRAVLVFWVDPKGLLLRRDVGAQGRLGATSVLARWATPPEALHPLLGGAAQSRVLLVLQEAGAAVRTRDGTAAVAGLSALASPDDGSHWETP